MNTARKFGGVSIGVSRRRGHAGLARRERKDERPEARLAVGSGRHDRRSEVDLPLAIAGRIARCVRKEFQAESSAGGAVERSGEGDIAPSERSGGKDGEVLQVVRSRIPVTIIVRRHAVVG